MLAGQEEAEAGACDVAVLAGDQPPETGEDLALVLPGDAEAVVADCDQRSTRFLGQAALDSPALGRVLDRVVEQLVEDRGGA